jgi:cold shock CspA family protein
MQATVRTFTPATRSGTLLRDDGTQLRFEAAAFAAGGYRLVRPGQRVEITVDGDRVTRVGLPGVGATATRHD